MTEEEEKEGTALLYDLIAQAKEYDDSIVLGRGDPDFDTPEHIIDAARDAMEDHSTDPLPPEGILPLREAIADRVERVNDIDVDPETEVVVTNGGQEALFLMVQTALGPGDEMVVPEPNYNTYVDALEFAGGEKASVETYPDEDFRIEPDRVRGAITDRTQALLMVSPNNPTANVISPETAEELVDIAIEHDLLILADDIYDHFVYDDFEHCSPASLPGARERTLTLNALSKAYSMTGWRTGWIVGPEDLMTQIKKIKSSLSGGSIVAQHAAVEALTGPQEPLKEMRDAYVKRRQIVMDTLDEIGLEYGVPQGGQFVYADIGFTGMTSGELSRRILEEEHVLAYPGSGFAEDQEYLRLTFLQPEPKLREGLDRLQRAMETLGVAE
jgi:aspartate/methionine/tyrosine aminotransferase